MSLVSDVPRLILEQGNIQAEGQRRHGAIVGGTLASIGQTVATIPYQIQRQKELAQEQQVRGLQLQSLQGDLAEKEQARARRAKVEQILSQYPNVEDAIGPLMTVDPEYGSRLQEHVDKAKKAGYEEYERQQKFITSTLQQIHDQGSLTSKKFTLQHAFKGRDFAEIPDDWDSAQPVIKEMILSSLSPEKRAELDIAGRRVAATESKEAREAEEATAKKPLLAAQIQEAQARIPLIQSQMQEAQARTPLIAAQAAEARARVPLIAAQTAGARASAAKTATEARQVASLTSGATVPDVGVGQTNDAFLQSLKPEVASQVKALAEGRMQFPSGSALRSEYWQSMLQAVAKYDPSFDAVNYNARSKTRADFTSGASAKQVNAINTVIGHLGTLSDAADALNNSNYPLFNKLANAVSTATGSPKVTNYNTIKKAVSDEVTRVWRQTGGAVEDIKQAQQNLDEAGSPDQLHGAIAKYGELLASKLLASNEQYRQGMGHDKIDILTPESKAALDKILGGAGAAMPTPAATPTKTRTIAQVDAAAKKNGTSYAEAKAWIESQGYTVVAK